MGNFRAKAANSGNIRKITDHVFDYFAQYTNTDKLSFQELYTAVLLVYNELNKHIPGGHYDPPMREEVHEMFKTFDKNSDNELSKEEFGQFMENFTSQLIGSVGRNLIIFSIIAPALAFVAKQATEGLPRVGMFVSRIPSPIYASIVTVIVIFIERMWKKI